jgi:hypothetical protein
MRTPSGDAGWSPDAIAVEARRLLEAVRDEVVRGKKAGTH